MNFLPKIECTTDYESFHLIPENRKVVHSHIEKLISDHSFPKKSCTSPILVDSNRNILDGQHRYHACMKLKIPVYFITDPEGKKEDILIRNQQQLKFTGLDTVNYYSNSIEDYNKILQLREKYDISLTMLNSAIKFFGGYKSISYFYELKKGNVRIWSFIKHLEDFLNIFVPALKSIVEAKGIRECRALFLEAYVTGCCYYFVKDIKLLKRFLDKFHTYPHQLVRYTKHEPCRGQIERISNWKPDVNKTEKKIQKIIDKN
jgi:hypothetical protein